MDPISLRPKIDAAKFSAEQVASSSSLNEQQKVAELSRQFEAVLLRQILAEAQKTVVKSKYHEDTAASGIYQDMINFQMADGISQSGGFGLAQSIKSQLTRQMAAPATTPATTGSHPKVETTHD